jgi:hypothetical protein
MKLVPGMRKVLIAKVAWCSAYQGDPAQGNFKYIKKHGGASGHEKFNFKPRHGIFRGYFPAESIQPGTTLEDRKGWTILWIAKKPGVPGVRLVGVYYDATFLKEYKDLQLGAESVTYIVTTKHAVLIPEEQRNFAFKSPISQAAFMYPTQPHFRGKYNRLIDKLLSLAQRTNAGQFKEAIDSDVPLRFPDPVHRKAVEEASMIAAEQHLISRGWTVKCVTDKPVGYDLHAMKGAKQMRVEVKGTAGENPYCYITRNELRTATLDREGTWYVFMVTNALDRKSAKVEIIPSKEFLKRFDFDPLAFVATEKQKVAGSKRR